MSLINSLKDLNLTEDKFPIFFWDNWKLIEEDFRTQVYIFHETETQSIIPFKITKLKFLIKAEYLFIPLDLYGEELNSTTERKSIELFHNYLKKNSLCDVIFPPQHITVFKSIPEKVYYYEIGILSISLNQTETEIFNRMSSNYRSKIRQAERNGVASEIDSKDISSFYELYSDNLKTQNLNFDSKEFFEQFTSKIRNNVLISNSKFNNILESSTYNVWDKKSCYYFYGGTQTRTQFAGSNKLLFWDLIKYLKERNIQNLILGGYRVNSNLSSKHNGIQNFKLKFGSDINMGFHFIKVFSPIRYNLFLSALRFKSILKRKDLSFINLSGLEIKKSK
jgi:lipid II:glycine glycyltransferase (peptidoglycan interpeptide bridge formation enzyme)